MDKSSSRKQAGQDVLAWYQTLKSTGGFGPVNDEIMANGRRTFESDRVSDAETLETIRSCYQQTKYILDPHSAVGITAAHRSMARANTHHISLSTAHPAKFSEVVTLALKDEAGFDFENQVLPDELKALAHKESRILHVGNSWQEVREIVKRLAEEDLNAQASG